MGFFDTLLGNDSAKAAKQAAADTYAKQQTASAGTRQAGDQYYTGMETQSHAYDPWRATGGAANDAVSRLIADPSSVRSLPAYQFMLGEGTRALDHSAAANGSLFSGRTGKALEAYGQNLADKTYGDQLLRLLGVSQQGLGATQAGVNTVGQGLGGQLGARTSSYGQDFNSAGTIGQGDVAAANAKTQGIQNLLNTGVSLAGMALAPMTGGLSLGAAGGIGKLLAPKGGYTGWTGGG